LKALYDIPGFARYVNIGNLRSKALHICRYDGREDLLYRSDPVTIDFYFLSVKSTVDKKVVNPVSGSNEAGTYLYLDGPGNTLEWDLEPPVSGYSIMVSTQYLGNYVKGYRFMHYNNHEALFLTREEERVLLDLFDKAYSEFQKDQFYKNVLVSYIVLILTYVQHLYARQFDSRSAMYQEVVSDFYKNIEAYFREDTILTNRSFTAYFAQKVNLTPDYFSDLIQHFTGITPTDHIQKYRMQLAKRKLKRTTIPICEIADTLGFPSPTSFSRFFKKKTGISPRAYRKQTVIS